jgi:hypothetical protein
VDVKAGMERANEIDGGEGPGVVFSKIASRFKPQSVWGNPTRRQAIMVVDLKTPADIAELMYALTWWAGGEPTFTPIMSPETYDVAIKAAKKIANPPQ